MIKTHSAIPCIGAQIWVDSTSTPEQIDQWMKTLADHKMPLTRIWLLWNLIETAPEQWNFSLYDTVFDAAQKHGVGIVATLTPGSGPSFRGFPPLIQRDTIPETREMHEQSLVYIEKTVDRYKNHLALDTWLLLNEPGLSPRVEEWALIHFRIWLADHYSSIEDLNHAWLTHFDAFSSVIFDESILRHPWSRPQWFVDWYEFWREHQTNQLKIWSQLVRKLDRYHPQHLNPHALIDNLACLSNNLPEWCAFLDSIGASIHPSWHFGLLHRDQYALGVSYICDLLRGAFEPLPFWVSELQGGTNIYSADQPICPDERDISQWVWISIGAGAKRVIYWLLNSRTNTYEAGEWSLLDYQGLPSERLANTARIVQATQEHADFFVGATPLTSSVTLILSLETMTLQERFDSSGFPGRGRNAHLLELLGIYEALTELGLTVRLKHIDHYKWDSVTGETIVLPHVSSLTTGQADAINAFIERGNHVLATGLTGFYDRNGRVTPLHKFPFARTFGGEFKEVKFSGDLVTVPLREPKLEVPAHLFLSELKPYSGVPLAQTDDRILALKNHVGQGNVTWIPALIGLGAWKGNRKPLRQLLRHLFRKSIENFPFRFEKEQPGVVLKILQNGDRYLTVLTNGTNIPTEVRLESPPKLHITATLWGNKKTHPKNIYWLEAKETVVHLWTRSDRVPLVRM